jgi:hypothetical protein
MSSFDMGINSWFTSIFLMADRAVIRVLSHSANPLRRYNI